MPFIKHKVKAMKKIRFNFPLRMWVDVAALSVPLFAIGMADDQTWALWWSGITLGIGIIGGCISLFHLVTERPIKDSPICKDISMAATYVWPCILGGLICDRCARLGCEGYPFYFLAFVVMGLILLVNHCDVI